MYYTDYHLHTSYSPDSATPMKDMIERAISLGLKEMALTDHYDFMADDNPYPYVPDYNAYLNEFNQLKEKYSKRINLVLGVEIGLGPHLKAQISELVSKYPFDFIIGSSHDIQKADLYCGGYYDGKDKDTAYRMYFEEVVENIRRINDFCVYGHFDYVNRYAPYEDTSFRYEDYKEIIDEGLRLLVEKGKGLEVNTSGYRYNLNQSHPRLEILKRFRELGGEIVTVGSDAHSPDRICSHFGDAYELIRAAGFERIAVFRGKMAEFVGINK